MKEHEKNLDLQDPKDYIDFYLKEIDNQKHIPESTFRSDRKILVRFFIS